MTPGGRRSTATSRPAHLRLVGYLRVSTKGQAVDGYGLDAQRRAMEEWAKRHGHRITRWCSDEGVSGTVDGLDREGLACALDALKSGEAHGLLAAALDRLARDLHVQEAVLAHVWKLDRHVFTADGGEVSRDDPDDPSRRAMRQMMGVFAELERATIAKRLRDGRRAKRARDGYAGGAPAFGQVPVAGALAEDKHEAKVISRMRTMRARGATYATIADALNADDVPTKRGGRWHPSTVQRVLDPIAQAKNRSYGRRRRQGEVL